MTNINTNARKNDRAAQIQAMRLAELDLTDKEDTLRCINDVKTYAGLDDDSAKVVAASMRSRLLPSLAKQFGISDAVTAQIIDRGNPMTDTFAKDDDTNSNLDETEGQEDPERGFGGRAHKRVPTELGESSSSDDIQDNDDFGNNDGSELDGGENTMPMADDDDETLENDADNGIGEDDDKPFHTSDEDDGSEMVKIEIETTRANLDKVKDALDQALGGNDFDDDDDDTGFPTTKTNKFPPSNDEGNLVPTEDGGDEGKFGKSASNASRRQIMSDKQIAARRASRETLLNNVRTAAENNDTKPKDIGLGSDTSHNGKPFNYAEEAQYHGEYKTPKLTMENSGGNSLKGQNPTFSKVRIPTNNSESLQLAGSYDATKFEGTPDGTLDYSPDFNYELKIPSAGGDDLRKNHEFALPTEMNSMLERNTNVTQSIRDAKCQGCNNPERYAVHENTCLDCNCRIAICEYCEEDGWCPTCAEKASRIAAYDDVDEGKTDSGETKRRKTQFEGTEMPEKDRNTHKKFEEGDPNTGSEKEAAVWKARVKTAYAVSAMLAAHGVIDPLAVEKNAEDYLSENLSPKAMKTIGELMYKTSQTAAARVAASSANVRTASVGISNFGIPSHATPKPVSDMQQALSGIFDIKDQYNNYSEELSTRKDRNRRY